jgi:hypothetical protein
LKKPEWHDFGPTFAAEPLAKRHQIHVGRDVAQMDDRRETVEEQGANDQGRARLEAAPNGVRRTGAESDATPQNMGVLWEHLEKNGRMVDVYTDRDSMFTVAPRPGESKEQQREADRLTQLGRAMRELGIWHTRRRPRGASNGAFARRRIVW